MRLLGCYQIKYLDKKNPNIRIDVALEAVESALTSNSNYTSTEIKAIIMLLNYTLRNSVVHYRGAWYLSKEGAPTGNPEVPPVANILVKYVLDEKILVHPTIMPMNKLEDRSRFLDDIWGLCVDTNDAFMSFLSQVNEVGQTFGVTFTGDCGQSVEFLDVTTIIIIIIIIIIIRTVAAARWPILLQQL